MLNKCCLLKSPNSCDKRLLFSPSYSPISVKHRAAEEDWGEWTDSNSYLVPALACKQIVPLDKKALTGYVRHNTGLGREPKLMKDIR